MGTYSIYETTNGRILSVIQCPDSMISLNIKSGQAYIEGYFNDYLYYFDTALDEVKLKPEMPASANKETIAANGTEEVVITLPTTEPNGTAISVHVSINDSTYEVSDGELIFTSDIANTFHIECRAVNYLPVTITVEAV